MVDEGGAAVVREMYRWLVEEQLSSYAIQKRVEERGVPTRGPNRRGWGQSSVVRILANPTYKGEAWYNRYQTAGARHPRGRDGFKDLRPGNRRGRALRPAAEWIAVPVPAIVAPDLWQCAQEQLRRNREHATRNNTKHDDLLRSLLICGHCRRRMIGVWNSVGHGRYMCAVR